MDAGVGIFSVEQKGKEAVYCPQGWIMIENTVDDASLHYGVRKSYMMSTEKAMNDYEKCIGLCRDSGKQVSRMEAVLNCLKGSSVAA